ncbi:NUDIX domain-containing protein [Alkalinema sp. FACHB-956]|uniref:NUDIX domain-containing protein n=1 Tax=Alkalinema sp. FACHB-956 TaxID=2692768 RepID=UPI00168A26FF|nr:NUDIX hydrolase [Alkalinema sp. FACHB-956]
MNLKTPYPAVDIIIELIDRPDRPIILIERHYEPLGWAIPGGFMDYGESAETTARREAMEEVGLAVELVDLLGFYSDPSRDQRQHVVTLVYIATATGEPKAGDDAKNSAIVPVHQIPKNLCFDHDLVLRDYLNYRHYGMRPRVSESR